MTTRLHVLVVDDEITARMAVAAELDNLGLQADCAASGDEAIRCIEANRYAAILIDIQMPGMNGFECAAAIRAYEKMHGLARAKIIGMSKWTEMFDEQTYREHGMDGLIGKPVALDDLKELQRKLNSPE